MSFRWGSKKEPPPLGVCAIYSEPTLEALYTSTCSHPTVADPRSQPTFVPGLMDLPDIRGPTTLETLTVGRIGRQMVRMKGGAVHGPNHEDPCHAMPSPSLTCWDWWRIRGFSSSPQGAGRSPQPSDPPVMARRAIFSPLNPTERRKDPKKAAHDQLKKGV